MSRKLITVFAPVVGLAMLAGCVPPPPAEIAVAPQPVAIAVPPVVLLPPPEPIPVPVPVARRHYTARITHPVPHRRHVVRRYSSVRTTYTTVWSPYCGSSAHPCNVEHTTAPIQ